MRFFIILFSFLIWISGGCAEEDSLNYAEVHCYVKGHSVSLFADKLFLESGRINIERIEVAATTFTGENITASHILPESYGDFVFVENDPRQPAIIKFTANIYHDLNIDFYPLQDSYKLILRDTVYGEVPIPSDSNDGDGGSDSDNEDEGDKDDGDNEGDDAGERMEVKLMKGAMTKGKIRMMRKTTTMRMKVKIMMRMTTKMTTTMMTTITMMIVKMTMEEFIPNEMAKL